MTVRKLPTLIAITAALGSVATISAATAQWRLAGALMGVLLTVVAVAALVRWNTPGRYAEKRAIAVLSERVAAVEDSMQPRRFAAQISKVVKGQTREIEALLQLHRWVETSEPMPPSGPWAMNPQGLLALFGLVRKNRPRVVLELGSGTSTVWIAYALAADWAKGDEAPSRPGRLVSIDHEPDYAAQTRELLRPHSDNVAPVEVRHAPLEPLQLGAERFDWYARDALSDLAVIDMLIVDGPPSGTGALARYPAVSALVDRLADGAVVVLDDASRDDERDIAGRWISENSGMSREGSPIGRLAVFRYRATT